MLIGVLALQGAFHEHITKLNDLKIEAIPIRTSAELQKVDGLIIPGGESTSMAIVSGREPNFLDELRQFSRNKPTWGTCAGMIFLAERLIGTKKNGQVTIGGLDATVARNFFGSQVDSFETMLQVPELGEKPIRAVFIRAPVMVEKGDSVKVIAQLEENEIVAARQKNILVTSFHPELTQDDRRWHHLCQYPHIAHHVKHLSIQLNGELGTDKIATLSLFTELNRLTIIKRDCTTQDMLDVLSSLPNPENIILEISAPRSKWNQSRSSTKRSSRITAPIPPREGRVRKSTDISRSNSQEEISKKDSPESREDSVKTYSSILEYSRYVAIADEGWATHKTFSFNSDLKKMGAHQSISLPDEVSKTGSFSVEHLQWAQEDLVMRGILQWATKEERETEGEYCLFGEMEQSLKAANVWSDRICDIERGIMTIYKNDKSFDARLRISLKNSTFVTQKDQEGLGSIFIITTNDFSEFSFRCISPDIFDHWLAALQLNGSLDRLALEKNRKQRVQEAIDEEKKRDRQYAQDRMRNLAQLASQITLQRTPPPERCSVIESDPIYTKSQIWLEGLSWSKTPTFTIRVIFGPQEWFIYRTEQEIYNLYNALVYRSYGGKINLDYLKGSYPKGLRGRSILENLDKYEDILRSINDERPLIFSQKPTRTLYTRFFGPLKYGDTKPPSFVMPFEIELD
ncbi:putative glutamine amidotransferase subunit PdxT [Planoprotostelium fungivorum]|uniref:glutaminase n=1 Tax=Planoprotostelium fungivorum TaxID=1890364 RepID=A0A2P6N0L0_9EUKA|nr:putative glutamine amidotransferase subunit PdxT [Planoprotostelium fungivorum]